MRRLLAVSLCISMCACLTPEVSVRDRRPNVLEAELGGRGFDRGAIEYERYVDRHVALGAGVSPYGIPVYLSGNLIGETHTL